MSVFDDILREILLYAKAHTDNKGTGCPFEHFALPESLAKFPEEIVGTIVNSAKREHLLTYVSDDILGSKHYVLSELGEEKLLQLNSPVGRD